MAQLLKDQRIYHICLKRRATGKRQGFCTVDPDINIKSHRIQLLSRVRHVQLLNDEARHITTSVSIMPYEMATLPLERTFDKHILPPNPQLPVRLAVNFGR
ncbi:hypothetical protein DTO166G4_1967 [Paecilomyces variotii]|nr:hypothetical protein DTO166G4_1967 [Paecilomyces variotii]KAJ9234653.1 hypothetical protein DTO166G5_5006 [Paecilomyces variotii]